MGSTALNGNDTYSPGAPDVPFYTPIQNPPAGTALVAGPEVPTLFTPFSLRSLTLQNRFVVSPMCTYSADDGHLTEFHVVHLGAYALRGAALAIVEASAVTPNGRISPQDSGLWKDSQTGPLKRVVDFVHSQGQKIGIQLAHAGRKASTRAPWLRTHGASEVVSAEQGGWPADVWGPSPIPFAPAYASPREMTVAEIGELVEAFAAAARRAVEAGVDTVEIHGAHGYLIHEFLSPLSNKRTDDYGGSFENRTRLLLETVRAVRAAIPETMPLLLRISATDWMEWNGAPSWDVEQSVRLAKLLPALGVDLLDVSSGGLDAAQKIQLDPYYQTDVAGQIREALLADAKMLAIGAVGLITTPELARDVVQEGGEKRKADLVLAARQFLREPEFVLRAARRLGVQVKWPNQYFRADWPRDVDI